MKRCFRHLWALVALFLLLPSFYEASAQRTMAGRGFATVTYSVTAFPKEVSRTLQYGIYGGQYQRDFYWDAGLEFTPVSYYTPLKSHVVGSACIVGGAMWRAFGMRSRAVNIYLGGHAVAGVDFGSNRPISDIFNSDNNNTVSGDEDFVPFQNTSGFYVFAPTKFTYGITPKVELEFFPITRLALVANFQLPLRFQSQLANAYGRFGFGARWNF